MHLRARRARLAAGATTARPGAVQRASRRAGAGCRSGRVTRAPISPSSAASRSTTWPWSTSAPSLAARDEAPMWAGKYLDERTGEIVTVYRSASGELGSTEVLEAARTDVGRDPDDLPAQGRCRARVRDRHPADGNRSRSRCGSRPTSPAPRPRCRQRIPRSQWLAGRPLAGTIEQARALRAELWEARRAVYAAAADTLAAEVEALGGRIGYASTSAPLVFVDLPAPSVDEPRGTLRRAQPRARGIVARDDDLGGRDGRRQLDHRQRGPGQRGARRRARVPQRRQHRRPGRPGRPALERHRPDRDEHPPHVGRRCGRPAGTAAGAGSRRGPTSSAPRPAELPQGSPATARSSRPPTGRCRPLAATWTS